MPICRLGGCCCSWFHLLKLRRSIVVIAEQTPNPDSVVAPVKILWSNHEAIVHQISWNKVTRRQDHVLSRWTRCPRRWDENNEVQQQVLRAETHNSNLLFRYLQTQFSKKTLTRYETNDSPLAAAIFKVVGADILSCPKESTGKRFSMHPRCVHALASMHLCFLFLHWPPSIGGSVHLSGPFFPCAFSFVSQVRCFRLCLH